MPTLSPEPAPTTAQIRGAIDDGRAGDKVAFPDPAAAPLGTDEEAAGTPATPAERRLEAGHSLRRDGGGRGDLERNPRAGLSSTVLGLGVGAAAAAVVAALLVGALG